MLEECERANGGTPITYFEITTAAAFLAFARTPADIVLLETGLGGRLDATNVIRRPAVTAITPISLDHQAFLGDTIAQIAGEKAGILKPGVPAVIGPQPARGRGGHRGARCRARRAACLAGSANGAATATGPACALPASAGSSICRCRRSPARTRSPMPAPRSPASSSCRAFRCRREAIAAGLRQIEWPARLQRLTRGPLVEMLPPGWELWLDGGHNPGAGAVLADVVAGWRDRPLYLVVGMLNTKDAAGFLGPLAPHAKALWPR